LPIGTLASARGAQKSSVASKEINYPAFRFFEAGVALVAFLVALTGAGAVRQFMDLARVLLNTFLQFRRMAENAIEAKKR
jgi:hypothetical protein